MEIPFLGRNVELPLSRKKVGVSAASIGLAALVALGIPISTYAV